MKSTGPPWPTYAPPSFETSVVVSAEVADGPVAHSLGWCLHHAATTTRPMASVAHLGHIEVLDPLGRPHPFSELWSEGLSVIALVRHFGCLFCHQQAAELLDARYELEQAGAHIRVLGNGNPVHAREFMQRVGMTSGVYTDPARILYDALGMVHGVRKTVNWRSTQYARDAHKRGFRQLGVRGARWQQGGCVVVNQEGELLYQYRSEVAGDHPPIEQVLDAVTSAQVG